jgi:hypothetical protein
MINLWIIIVALLLFSRFPVENALFQSGEKTTLNQCFLRATLINLRLISVALLFFPFSCGKLRKTTLK